MDVRAILQSLLRICDGSDDYFVSGSLSFLPLIGYYRAPGHDVDVAMSDILFQRRFAAINHEGTVTVLRLREVAVTDNALVSRLLSPKTAFAHVETSGGLLDLARYRSFSSSLEFALGLGLSMCLPALVLERIRFFDWEGLTYRAGPIELAFIPKALAHDRFASAAKRGDSEARKHLLDLERLAPLVDWQFIELLWQRGLSWRRHPLPLSVAKALFSLPDLELLKAKFTCSATSG